MSELKKHQPHIHQDKSRASINAKGGFGKNEGGFYIAEGKREFVPGPYLASDHMISLQKEKHWYLFQRQKLLLHYIKYVLQLLRCIAVCRYVAIQPAYMKQAGILTRKP